MLSPLLDLELLRAYRSKAEMFKLGKLVSRDQRKKDAAAKKKAM